MATNANQVPGGDLPIIYLEVEQRHQAIVALDAAAEMATHGEKLLVITSDEQLAVAIEYAAQGKRVVKEAEAERLETTRGLRARIERINARFNTPIDTVTGRVKAVEKATLSYMAEKDRKAREERAAAERAQAAEHAKAVAEAEAASAPPPPPPTPIAVAPSQSAFKATGIAGSSGGARDNWKWKLTAIEKVPDAYLVEPLDRIQKTLMNSAIKAKAKARLAALNLGPSDQIPDTFDDLIPGIEAFNEKVLASKAL